MSIKEIKHLIIGIDGGATKTLGIVSGFDGEPIGTMQSGPSNYLIIGAKKCAITLQNLILSLIKEHNLKLQNVASIIIGLAGAGRENDKKIILNELYSLAKIKKIKFPKIIILSDAEVALYGAFSLKNGAILIAGTGSILYAKTEKNKIIRVGGWGRIVGDLGSGYFLGKEGITAVLKDLDFSGEKTILTKKIKEIYKLDNAQKIIYEIYKNNFDIPEFAKIVIQTASEKDKVALEILNRGAVELASLVKPIANKKIKIALIGSLFKNNSVYKKIVTKKIKSKFKNIKIVEAEHSPAYGAVLYGLEKINV